MDSRLGLPVNTVLDGSYRIERVVGSGGFGITYEAEDINLATKVAIKEYYPFDFGDRDATMSVKPKSDRHRQTFDWGRHVRARALSPSAGKPCGGRHCPCSPLWGLPLGQWLAGTAAAWEWVSRRPAVQMSGDSHLARAAIALHCRASSNRLGRP